MVSEMSGDEYLMRVAVHGTLPDAGVPRDVATTHEELNDVVEILFFRSDHRYRVRSRHNQTLFLDHGGGPFDDFQAAVEAAINVSRKERHPILRNVYAYAPANTANELGSERIPKPWLDDGDTE